MAAVSFTRRYSSRRSTSSARGSSSRPSLGRGSSIFDLSWRSQDAIEMNSPAISMSSSVIRRNVSWYWSQMTAIGMS